LCEVEEAVSEMDMAEIPDDIVETEDEIQLVVSGWSVYVESLNLSLREGVVCIWDEEEEMFLPDYSVTVVYEGEIAQNEWLYFEQDGFAITLANWLNGRLPMEQIEQLWCELIMPESNI
jgi:hypothetical protein